MAGGKMSARQKMINLMYLVFIAMLAMNMSKEVLSAFGFMNEKLTENNISTTVKNNDAYTNLATKASEQAAKFGPLKIQADKIKKASSDFYTYLEDLKIKMTADIEDKTDYESMDKTAFLDEYFFKGDKYTKEGQDFIDRINGYRNNLITILGNDSKFANVINKRFSTDPVVPKKKDGSKKPRPWLDYRYKGFPLVASLTNLTQMQADIKNTESDIVTDLLGGQLESEVSMTNYNGIVKLEKNAFYPGDEVVGTVVLGREDPSLKPSRVVLDGKPYDNFKEGAVNLNLRAGNVGDKQIKGTIYFMENGEEVPVPFSTSYSVISKPNSAVVSADKMNVVYRGVQNPLTISIPGVPANLVKASAPGLRQVKGSSYTISPKGGNEVTINVSGKLQDGTPIKTPKTFRIKDIPAAMASARGQYGIVPMPKTSLGRTPIGAGLPDFVFDLKLKVNSFKVKVPGQVTVLVNGTVFNARAKKALSKAKRGDVVTIFDVNASIVGNSSYKLKKVLPVSIQITN
ncbi:type IX secretion system motor protein PorM/GldM [Polaribacter aquimarinus]|uniref:Gliding motility protein GldM n=1 Tax=Polaribacter aquimarinus TaxID=2100726 RepID=A0A2U2J8J4_9FLAO|nr:gliding motility protein GldM [Polaribacter aquimarinus]PWG04659.1 gliding motility protein GldM [Polaribacter aquimarinus]